MARCEQYVEAIQALVDGAPGSRLAADLDQHVEICPACRELMADLRRIREEARALPRLEPPARVWAALESRLANSADESRVAGSRMLGGWMPWAAWFAAAAALVIAVGAGIIWRTEQPRHVDAVTSPAASEPAPNAASIEQEFRFAAEHYERAIAGLEAIEKSNQGSLDPQIAATLQRNLNLIDQAIAESRKAVESQPNSQPAQESLFEAFRQKVALLQDTVSLINEMRKGNQAETARIVQGMRK